MDQIKDAEQPIQEKALKLEKLIKKWSKELDQPVHHYFVGTSETKHVCFQWFGTETGGRELVVLIKSERHVVVVTAEGINDNEIHLSGVLAIEPYFKWLLTGKLKVEPNLIIYDEID